jgi:3-phenylpropionate/trans-cinnamate dioxygenase ferredoxin component
VAKGAALIQVKRFAFSGQLSAIKLPIPGEGRNHQGNMNESQTGRLIRVCKVTDIPDPGKRVVEVNGRFVALFHVEGRFFALDDYCTHDGGPLGEGRLQGFTIICPRHGAKFDIRTGRVLSMPAVCDIPAYEVKVEGDDVFLALPG